MGVFNCSMFCCKLLYVHSSFAIIFIWKRESFLLCLVCLSGGSVARDCSVTLPRGVMGLSVVCDYGIS